MKYWILLFLSFLHMLFIMEALGDKERTRRVTLVIKRVPAYRRANSLGKNSYHNRIQHNSEVGKSPSYGHDKYKLRHKYLNHREYLRTIEKRRPRIIHKPIKHYEIHSTSSLSSSTPPPIKESLNIDQPDSPYGLIHKFFPVDSNEIVETKMEEIPKDLDPDEVWLSDGPLLVLKVGSLRNNIKEEYKDRKLRVSRAEEEILDPQKEYITTIILEVDSAQQHHVNDEGLP
ncbi:uncharacterized protein [Lepeophtheirus salmonis]|uniref:uncharacterized protein isoform X2 n=1 Tax=Lepeophtheirus salmonis TaxID=72036 RepID=UPI001AEBA619|nr:uncharacterized protein LOC121118623 isoform X1 [Lepeophtheirus salmonis]